MGGLGALLGWVLPIWGSCQEDLQGHGEAGQLCHAVCHGSCGSPQLQQVGHGVHDASRTEDEEVDPGHCRTGLQQRVHSSEEEEGEDVLHVVAMCPVKRNRLLLPTWLPAC